MLIKALQICILTTMVIVFTHLFSQEQEILFFFFFFFFFLQFKLDSCNRKSSFPVQNISWPSNLTLTHICQHIHITVLCTFVSHSKKYVRDTQSGSESSRQLGRSFFFFFGKRHHALLKLRDTFFCWDHNEMLMESTLLQESNISSCQRGWLMNYQYRCSCVDARREQMDLVTSCLLTASFNVCFI